MSSSETLSPSTRALANGGNIAVPVDSPSPVGSYRSSSLCCSWKVATASATRSAARAVESGLGGCSSSRTERASSASSSVPVFRSTGGRTTWSGELDPNVGSRLVAGSSTSTTSGLPVDRCDFVDRFERDDFVKEVRGAMLFDRAASSIVPGSSRASRPRPAPGSTTSSNSDGFPDVVEQVRRLRRPAPPPRPSRRSMPEHRHRPGSSRSTGPALLPALPRRPEARPERPARPERSTVVSVLFARDFRCFGLVFS